MSHFRSAMLFILPLGLLAIGCEVPTDQPIREAQIEEITVIKQTAEAAQKKNNQLEKQLLDLDNLNQQSQQLTQQLQAELAAAENKLTELTASHEELSQRWTLAQEQIANLNQALNQRDEKIATVIAILAPLPNPSATPPTAADSETNLDQTQQD